MNPYLLIKVVRLFIPCPGGTAIVPTVSLFLVARVRLRQQLSSCQIDRMDCERQD